jgi:hypothetical protein
MDELVDSADLEWRDAERARFFMSIITSALAPTNTLPGNPAALKRAFETSGLSVLRGTRNLRRDVRHNRGMPSQVDRRTLVIGKDLAATPGAVVYRDDVCEVIQYAPTTPHVHARPVVIIPPQINKYYFLDLAPGRSLVEYVVSPGYRSSDQLAKPRPRSGQLEPRHVRSGGPSLDRRSAEGDPQRRRERPVVLRRRDPHRDDPQPPSQSEPTSACEARAPG